MRRKPRESEGAARKTTQKQCKNSSGAVSAFALFFRKTAQNSSNGVVFEREKQVLKNNFRNSSKTGSATVVKPPIVLFQKQTRPKPTTISIEIDVITFKGGVRKIIRRSEGRSSSETECRYRYLLSTYFE
jgi:hypothetical protein